MLKRLLVILLVCICVPVYADQVTDYIDAHPTVVCYGGYGECTAINCPPYADIKGWHYPQCNTCTYFYQCTDGHTITEINPAGGFSLQERSKGRATVVPSKVEL